MASPSNQSSWGEINPQIQFYHKMEYVQEKQTNKKTDDAF